MSSRSPWMTSTGQRDATQRAPPASARSGTSGVASSATRSVSPRSVSRPQPTQSSITLRRVRLAEPPDRRRTAGTRRSPRASSAALYLCQPRSRRRTASNGSRLVRSGARGRHRSGTAGCRPRQTPATRSGNSVAASSRPPAAQAQADHDRLGRRRAASSTAIRSAACTSVGVRRRVAAAGPTLPLPRGSTVITRKYRDRYGTCSFHIRANRPISQAGSSTIVAGSRCPLGRSRPRSRF